MIKYRQEVIKILGKSWRIRLCTPRYFRKHRTHKNDVGVTDGDRRCVYFLGAGLCKKTIAHELTHAYLYELCLGSTSLSLDEFEEIVAELIARHGKDLFKQTKLLSIILS